MPTVVHPASSALATAATAASSHSAINRGLPSTSTSPDPSARAVSASETVILASPRRPVRRFTGHQANPRPRRIVHVIDSDVLERVLAGAVRTGADFAEVYAEDKRSTSAGLDDGRVEQVSSGRDRGAGDS